MKQIDKMSRLTGELEKAFRMLNTDFFEGKLPTPVITVIPSAKSYAHYTTYNAWSTASGAKREINIASGTLDRPLENIIASLLHEMTHMWNDLILHEQDVSGSSGAYHNRVFKREAEKRGLTITRSDKYGWSTTQPNDTLIEWLCEHEELREIEMNRTQLFTPATVGVGARTTNRTTTVKPPRDSNSHHRRYVCPCCKTVIRATKQINIMCIDCKEVFTESY